MRKIMILSLVFLCTWLGLLFIGEVDWNGALSVYSDHSEEKSEGPSVAEEKNSKGKLASGPKSSGDSVKKSEVVREKEAEKKDEEQKGLQHFTEPTIIYHGTKQVALTFDDGPDDQYTEEALSILKEKKVPATFFVVGKQVQQFPKVAKKIVEDGHIIANHSWDHSSLPSLSTAQIEEQLQRTYEEVYQATGKKMALMRPPYGAIKGIEKKVAHQGYRIVQWDIDTNDWKKPSHQKIVKQVEKEAKPGSIVLLHSAGGDRSATVRALPKIIENLREEGYLFVTVDEIADVPAYWK